MKKLYPYFNTVILIALLVFNQQALFAQSPPPSDYSFINNTLIAGTDKAVGAQYRFTSVKTGIDAIVTIASAVNATVATLDQTGVGWNEGFQPGITVNRLTSGYVEFNVNFVIAGTFIPAPQAQVAVTALDIDGYSLAPNMQLREYEEFDFGTNAYAEYEFSGSDIAVTFIANKIKGINVSGVDYTGISLSQNVRFGVFKSNVSSFTIRSGVNNNDEYNDVTRQRSIYFARFAYTNPVLLETSDVKVFKASTNQNNSSTIGWTLAKNHTTQQIDIEYSTDGSTFKFLKSIAHPKEGDFTYIDNNVYSGMHYYRLKLSDKSSKYIHSNIIAVKLNIENAKLAIYPTICAEKTTISLKAKKECSGKLIVRNYNGKIFINKTLNINEGANSIALNVTSSLPSGIYIVSIETSSEAYTGKIIKK